MKPRLSLGVIGHVDHGKTSLVHALTGTDTDRLREEKQRGMSIVLGFAWLELAEGVIDFVDVPGHEQFVRTMVSGATGFEGVLLVVDGREGIMPQTREHLAITQLLGVRTGVVVITKRDLLSEHARAALLAQLRGALRGTPLEHAQRVFTSARTGEGLDALRSVLGQLLRSHQPVPAAGTFWLPADRVFSIAGRGTVVTGTLRGGSVTTGDEIEIMPEGLRTRVRCIEVHGRAVECAHAGQRAGLNLRHVKPDDVRRGSTIAAPGLLRASLLLDAQLHVLPQAAKGVLHGQRVRLLIGTCDVQARVRTLGASGIDAGASGPVQLVCASPVAAATGERFIIRSDTPPATLGGGRVLDPVPVRHRHADPRVLARLATLASATGNQALINRVQEGGAAGVPLEVLAARLGASVMQVREWVQAAAPMLLVHDRALHRAAFARLCDSLEAALRDFHGTHATRAGATLAHCRTHLAPAVCEPVFRAALDALSAAGRIEVDKGLVRLHGYDPLAALNDEEREWVAAIEAAFLHGGATPPDPECVIDGNARRQQLFQLLVERGTLVQIPGEQPGRRIAFHREIVGNIDRRLRERFAPPAQFTVSEARALLGSTRKYMVPLLEYFDGAGYTRRRGDRRVIVQPEQRRR